MNIIISETQHSRLIQKLKEDKDTSAKFIKCRNCNKKYTQTIHKGKNAGCFLPHLQPPAPKQQADYSNV